jgi:hypothetical protein
LARRALPATHDAALIKAHESFLAQMELLRKPYEAVKPAVRALKENADDAAANRAVGEFLCFAKREWDKGLPLLVRSGEEGLAEAARKELAQPASHDDQVALADAWVALAKNNPGARAAVQQRACRWYCQALQQPGGKDNGRIEKAVLDLAGFYPEGRAPWEHLDLAAAKGVAVVGDAYLRLGPGQVVGLKKKTTGAVDITVVCRTSRGAPRLALWRGADLVALWENSDKICRTTRPRRWTSEVMFNFVPGTWYTFKCQLTESGADLSVDGRPCGHDATRFNLSQVPQVIGVQARDGTLEVRSLTVDAVSK